MQRFVINVFCSFTVDFQQLDNKNLLISLLVFVSYYNRRCFLQEIDVVNIFLA